MLLTYLFLPDTTGLDLKEQERRWHYIRTGREDQYHGIAIHPQHLSLYERLRGIGKNYNADLDYKQKIEEMRQEWEEDQTETMAAEMRGKNEGIGTSSGVDVMATEENDGGWTDEVHSYYRNTASAVRTEEGMDKEKPF